MRGLAVLLGGAILVCAIAILAWSSGDPAETDPAETSAVATEQREQVTDIHTPVEGALRKETEGQPRDPTTPNHGTRERLPVATEDPASSGDEIEVEIRCILKATGKPAGQAEVLHSDPTFDWKSISEANKAEAKRLQRDREAWLRRFGSQTRADDAGIVKLSLKSRGKQRTSFVEACARLGNLYGQIQVQVTGEAATRKHEILLEPDLELTVQTVDPHGRPVVGIPIAIRKRHKDDWFDTVFSYAHSIGTTEGARARLEIRHLQLYVRNVMTSGGKKRVRLCLHIPGHDLVGEDVDLGALPAEPVKLVVPPTGRVEITSVDRLGKPLEGSHNVSVFVAGQTKPGTDDNGVQVHPCRWDLQQRSGKPALLSHVGLGLQLEAVVGNFWAANADRKIFDGPRRSGETVAVKVSAGGGEPTLIGRVLGPGGSPLVETKLACEIYSKGQDHPGKYWPKTDSEGHFHLQLRPGRSPAVLHRVRLAGLDSEGQPRGIDAVCPLAGTLRSGQAVIDLGDVQLLETPLMAAGQLVGQGDLSKVHLSVRRVTPGAVTVRQRGIDSLLKRDHSFELRGRPGPGTLQLHVDSSKHLPVPPITFAPGQRNLRIHLQTGGEVVAVVRWQEYDGYWGLKTRLTPVDSTVLALAAACDRSPLRSSQDFDHLDDKGLGIRYRWSSLWPGSYNLEVLLYGESKPLARVEDILVRQGEVTKGGPLDLDLTKQVYKAMLVLVDGDGQPIGSAKGSGLAVLLDGDRPAGPVFAASYGWASLVGTQPSFDVRLIVPGYRPKIVRGITGKKKVRMERGLPLRFVLSASSMPPSLPGDVVSITLETPWAAITGTLGSSLLDPRAGGETTLPKDLSYQACFTRGSRELSMDVPVPGRYRVTVAVGPKPPTDYFRPSKKRRTVPGVTPREITVRDVSSPQRFELKVPEGAFERSATPADPTPGERR